MSRNAFIALVFLAPLDSCTKQGDIWPYHNLAIPKSKQFMDTALPLIPENWVQMEGQVRKIRSNTCCANTLMNELKNNASGPQIKWAKAYTFLRVCIL